MKTPPPPPDQNPFPPNWDLEDEGAGATREVETDELFELSGFLDEMVGPALPAVAPIPPPVLELDLDFPPNFDETQPLSRPPTTMRPAMSQDEYVEHMMRQAPPSDAGMHPLGGVEDGFGMLTPWPASVPPERDPASITGLFEHKEALGAPRVPQDLEDPSGRGSASFGDADFDEIAPEFLGPRATPAAPPPQILMDELDQLLIDEVMRAVRPGPGEPAATTRSPGMRAPLKLPLPIPEPSSVDVASPPALELELDDPLFMPPSEAGLTRVLSMLDPTKSEPPAPSTEPIDLPNIPISKPFAEPQVAALADMEPVPPTVAPDTVQDAARVFEMTARLDSSLRARLDKVRARFEVGDFSGALVLAEAMLEEDPRHLAAKCYADSCRAMLRQMYLARIGDKASVLRQVMDSEEVKTLQLDHRAGFLFSLADGVNTIDEILDVSGMPALDALRILYELIQEGVVEAEAPPSVRSRGEQRRRRRGDDTPGTRGTTETTSRRR
jgi:hypothetical protein